MLEEVGLIPDMARYIQMFHAQYVTKGHVYSFEQTAWDNYASTNNVTTDDINEYFVQFSHYLHVLRGRLYGINGKITNQWKEAIAEEKRKLAEDRSWRMHVWRRSGRVRMHIWRSY